MTWIDEHISELEDVKADFNESKASKAVADAQASLREQGFPSDERLNFNGCGIWVIDETGNLEMPALTESEWIEDVEAIIAKLEWCRKMRSDPMSKYYQGHQPNMEQTVTVNAPVTVTSASRSNSLASATAVTYGEACCGVEALDLDEDLKDELKDLLHEAEKAKKDESLARKAVSKLLEKAVDAGFDALVAVLPYVWGLAAAFAGTAA